METRNGMYVYRQIEEEILYSAGKKGRYTYCQAAKDFEEYRKELLEEFIDRLYDGNKLKLMDELCE